MLRDEILKHPARVLTEPQRAAFFAKGYLTLPDYVPERWLARLRAALAELMMRSRNVTQSDDTFILEEGHSAARPRLHRVTSPQDQHATFWEFMCDPVMTDLAADVVGPDVKFHHAKLNVKSERGTRGFKWHQDIPAWPHTDYSPVSIGVYIEGCTLEQGPLAFAPGTPRRAALQHVRPRRQFRGADPRRGSDLAHRRSGGARDRRARHHRAAQLPHCPWLS